MPNQKITVLLVDDNDMMRAVLRAMLRGEHYEVIGESRNGTQAVEHADRLKPDIVCLDIQMPEKDGLQALCEIKATRSETEVVMITGSSDMETVQEAIQNGASGFVIKPFNAASVLDTLDRVSNRLRQKR
ncbi:MAG: response regulator [Dechloromonas sp.]|nr:response regulator [Dechloromonas sp.]